MSHEFAQRANDLFRQVMEYPATERPGFLDEACGDDARLRHEIESLLAASDRAGVFLETPAVARFGSNRFEEPNQSMIDRRIADFTIKSVIASGGMGTVFLAEQVNPRRTVALKVMRSGIVSRSARRRFEYESEILGRLQHPNIAQVHDAGIFDDGTCDVPYFAMEYVADAKPLTEYAQSRDLNLQERLQLFASVCDAVHFGHQKGVVHRDLKPANILVDGAGLVKVIDFGVARAADTDIAMSTMQTNVGQLIGTLVYMSPEQTEADPAKIDVRSDVYSLGVMLHQLLCGELPYSIAGCSFYDAARIIRDQPPMPLSRIRPSIGDDLETITLKALEKDPQRRYQSAADLARDIRRYLNTEPIEARPPSVVYQARMFARRNRALVAGAAIAVAALVAGAILATIFALGQIHARNQADLRRQEAQRQTRIAQSVNDFLNLDLLRAADPYFSGDRDLTVRQALDAASASIGDRFAAEPLVEAAVRDTIGSVYLNLGLTDQAQPHLERALALRSDVMGADDPNTLHSLQQLAWLRYHQQRYDEAEPLLIDALHRRQQVLGAEHADTLRTSHVLASLYARQHRMDEAEELYLSTLAARQRSVPPNDLDIAESMDGLARLYRDTSRYDKAEPLYDRVLEIDRAAWGEEHRITLYAMGNLARLYNKQGRYTDAVPLYVKSLELSRRVLGEDHPDTLVYMGDLGSLYTNQGKLDQAEPLLTDTLERERRIHGEAHANTLQSMGNLAQLYARRRQFDRAEALFTEAIDGSRTLEGNDHPDTLKLEFNFAFMRDAQGRFDEAESLYQHVLEVRRRTLGEKSPDTLTCLHNLAFMYGNQKRFAESEAMFRQVLEAQREQLGDSNKTVALTLSNLGEIVRQQDRFEEAAALLQESVDTWHRSPTPRHPFAAQALGHLGGTLRQLNRLSDAEPRYREALEIQRENGGKGPALSMVGLLGDCIAAQKRFEEAEPLLLESYELCKDGPAAQQQRAVQRLINLYEGWGRTEDAAKWRASTMP